MFRACAKISRCFRVAAAVRNKRTHTALLRDICALDLEHRIEDAAADQDASRLFSVSQDRQLGGGSTGG
jgi:hypothetical protein